MAFIQINNLRFKYEKQERYAINDVSLSVNEGDFILLIGKSGCGKSTLLRKLKKEIAPFGETSGEILYRGKDMYNLPLRESASEIGFVMQNPDNQIVTDKVFHELAFGLENLGLDNAIIKRRVAEMASYFGIQTWFRKDISSLSGGQKQLLNLAAIMAMQPKVLILDEPTSQLDPIASKEFIEAIYKINRDLGVTVIISEHRLEDLLPYTDRVVLMDEGKIIADTTPSEIGGKIYNGGEPHPMFHSLPAMVKSFEEIDRGESCPITTREARKWVSNLAINNNIDNQEICVSKESYFKVKKDKESIKPTIELKNVWFKYEKDGNDVLRGVNLKAYKGETLAILGGNGVGKTTMLSVIAGNNKHYRGDVFINDIKLSKYKLKDLYTENLGILPQNPQSLFIKSTVIEDLKEVLYERGKTNEEIEKEVNDVCNELGLNSFLNMHPYDLSGGEQQKVGLAKILLLRPKILILDEPTKGLDGYYKKQLSDIFKRLKDKGVTIIMVTHDIEFSAENADRCALFFDGEVASSGTPKDFFGGNNFYTTATNKMTRGIIDGLITYEELVELCK